LGFFYYVVQFSFAILSEQAVGIFAPNANIEAVIV